MATKYIPRGQVRCAHCGETMTKRRDSKSGRYYCQQPDCQKVRRQVWMEHRGSRNAALAQDDLNKAVTFVRAAVMARQGGATCPDCGFTQAPAGYAHYDQQGGRCAGLGDYNNPIHGPVVEAVWPPSERKYVEQ